MFSDAIRTHRRRLGLTQEELAERAGLSVRSVGKLESGRTTTPRPPTVRLLADALGLTGADRERFCAAAGDPAPGPAPAAAEPAEPVRPVPAQLPADAAVFTGREAELAALSDALDARAGPGGPVVISAIGGTGGIGKTWLAVHWAHRHLARFPDGQLFVNLRGFDPSGQPVVPAEAVRGFLDALGVPVQSIPAETSAQVGLYRSLVAGRRMLVVLDNARDPAQVSDLLPGTDSCVVLITSRDRLAGLIRSHGARPVPVDVLDDAQARTLLARRLGARRLAAEPDAVARIMAACGGLPLALGIVAARAVLAPQLSLAAIARELGDSATRLAAFDEDPQSGLRAVLSWSYAALSDTQARTFCLLGSAPSPDIGPGAAAALTGLSVEEIRPVLRALERQSLLGQPTPGRWRLHDLLRLYAAERSAVDVPAADRRAALHRLVEHHRHTAFAAERLLDPHRAPITVTGAPPAGTGGPPADESAAWAWLEQERVGSLAAQRLAADEGWDDAVWQLAWCLDTFHWRRGHVHDQLAVWQAGLAAAERLGDPTAEAIAHRRVGSSYGRVGRHAEATAHLDRALLAQESAGDLAAQAETHRALAWTAEMRGDDEGALEHALRALRLFRATGDPVREAAALNSAGWCSARLGRHEQAREHLDAALDAARRLGNHLVEGATLDSLGYLAHRTGRYGDAQEHYRQALTVARSLGDTYSEAEYHDRLGDSYQATGDDEPARRHWRSALRLYESQHRVAEADRTRRRLADADG